MTTSPRSQDIVYGHSLHLSCQVSAYPPVDQNVMWYKDGLPVSDALSTDVPDTDGIVRSSNLMINGTTEMDCGTYSCYNSMESPASIRRQLFCYCCFLGPLIELSLFVQ